MQPPSQHDPIISLPFTPTPHTTLGRRPEAFAAGHVDALCGALWRCRVVARPTGPVEFETRNALVGRTAEQGS